MITLWNERRARMRRAREADARAACVALFSAIALLGCAEPADAPVEAPARAQAAPPAQAPTIKSVTTRGTGCDPESADVLFDAASQSFTVRFSEYAAEVSPEEPAYRVLKECFISLDVVAPRGYRYAVTAFRMHGYAALDPGVLGAAHVGYTFVGAPDRTAVFQRSHDLAGPFDDAFDFYDAVPPTQLSWSDCDTPRTLVLNTRIMLTNEVRPPAFGTMTMTRVDADTRFLDVEVGWQRCPTGP